MTRTDAPRFAEPFAWHRLAHGLGYLALYVAVGWVSFIHPMRGLNITPWNPQAALAVGLLVWRPGAWWLVWLALLIDETWVSDYPTPPAALVLSTGLLCIGYAATAWALGRWARPRGPLVTRRDLVLFCAIAAAGALVCAALRVAGLAVFDAVPQGRELAAIHRGVIGDGVALLVTLPLLHLLGTRERRAAVRAMFESLQWWLIVGVTVASIVAVFTRAADEQFKFFYLLFLPVIWSAARFGVTGAVLSAAVVQVTMIAAVQSVAYRPLTVFELQTLVAVLAATGLLLGATVDEREEAARSLQASLRMAAAGDMAAALAHELNQPLAAMGNYAQALRVMAADGAQGREGARASIVEVSDKLGDEADRAAVVVKRLRDFFRERTTGLQPTAPTALFEQAVGAQARRAAAQQVRLSWTCALTDESLWVDPVQVAVVLRNLLANALDAAAAGGWVTLEVTTDGDEALVSVTDSGPGLHGDETVRVFERRTSDKPGGMGVGLAISRSIVEAHGGKLWAEPGPQGHFLFTLPLGAPSSHA